MALILPPGTEPPKPRLSERLQGFAQKWRTLLLTVEFGFVLVWVIAAMEYGSDLTLLCTFLAVGFCSSAIFVLASTSGKKGALIIAEAVLFLSAGLVIHQHFAASAHRHAPLKITSFEIAPYVAGAVPELRMHIRTTDDSSLRAALQYDPYTVGINQGIDEFTSRKELEPKLWSRFMSGLNLITTRRIFLSIPIGQDAWFPMKGIDPVRESDLHQNPATVRFYFLARVFDVDGKKIFDSCVFIEPNSTAIKYCIDHND